MYVIFFFLENDSFKNIYIYIYIYIEREKKKLLSTKKNIFFQLIIDRFPLTYFLNTSMTVESTKTICTSSLTTCPSSFPLKQSAIRFPLVKQLIISIETNYGWFSINNISE